MEAPSTENSTEACTQERSGVCYRSYRTSIMEILADTAVYSASGKEITVSGLKTARERPVALAFVFCIGWAAVLQPVRAQTSSGESAAGSYLVCSRTPAHVSRSSADVFHEASDTVKSYLEENHVQLVSDPVRPMIQTEEVFSNDSLLRLAKDAGAMYLLHLLVDRPASQWLKLTVECYDVSGKFLWQEAATSGMGGLNGKNAMAKTMAKLTKQLAPRIGKPGLPIQPASAQSKQ